MPESDRTVKCPICDEDFDPTVAGGWCTNPDCGEWQHTDDAATEADADDGSPSDSELIAEGADETGPSNTHSADESGAVDDADVSTGEDDEDEEASADEPVSSDHETEEIVTEDEAEEDTEDARQTEQDTDTTGGEPDEAGDDADESVEAADENADADDEATITCPDCERDLDADANFCVDCGADVQDITPGDDGSLDACPSCGADVDDEASFCVNCGEDLDAHRGESDASTTDSASDSSTADETRAESAAAGNAVETLASHSTDDEAVPDKLVLSVEGRDITVEDGDRIGREIRAALLDAGRPEDEAVRIHREHVRFDRQPEGFYLVDLGDNPTRLNGTAMKKGDREPVQPGDELELSGVVTMTIRAA